MITKELRNTPSIPKCLTPLTFFKMFDRSSYSKVKNFCEICKIICLHENIFNNESNDKKRINNYLNFLNKTNGQIFLKKVNGVKHFGMEGVLDMMFL